MPKYFAYKVYGYFLYFTSHCIVEAMHVHASDGKLTEEGAAKFFVREDGSSRVMERGRLDDRELSGIQAFIAMHYREMYLRWAEFSDRGFYRG